MHYYILLLILCESSRNQKFKKFNTLRSKLTKTKPKRESQNSKNCIYEISEEETRTQLNCFYPLVRQQNITNYVYIQNS